MYLYADIVVNALISIVNHMIIVKIFVIVFPCVVLALIASDFMMKNILMKKNILFNHHVHLHHFIVDILLPYLSREIQKAYLLMYKTIVHNILMYVDSDEIVMKKRIYTGKLPFILHDRTVHMVINVVKLIKKTI